ncbi:prevent-host-death family protein [Providencia rettgeri]|uniref:TcdA/TcdB pore-forming domain-containing protein n=1 Tax=Providencia rettgeri TaxID=587 RepID=UPI001419AF92|nr:TcdA/TcdB pore-forming domain-containing protein [Providencia rettgeri]NIA76181.1 prevent-host-death family protein [Providencia rettgeri]NIA80351.1 prevent-host-death family protein [Providencia rettgeri]NIB03599.1 prevent-host-death family protein [Providencia rettgeri]NIB07758.1 prevent-host-death family protein [Providencia rettgeri]NIB21370.1 prevent-host-death family protein [Providencia rettgeri]
MIVINDAQKKIGKELIKSNDINLITSNFIEFTQRNAINTDSITHFEQPFTEGRIQFIKVADGAYSMEYASGSDVLRDGESIESYFLGCNRINDNNKRPIYIDIPKNAKEIKFLFTGTLSGHSIIVTDLNSESYRVYQDRRTNSSILYDNVVMAIDYNDYRVEGSHGGIATAYMQYINGKWQLLLQKQKYKIEGNIAIPIFRDENKPLDSYHASVNFLSYKKRKFIEYRGRLHKRILNLAKLYNIPTNDINKDNFEFDDFSLDNLASNPWVVIINNISNKIKSDSILLKQLLKKWESELKHLESLSLNKVKERNRINVLKTKTAKNRMYLLFITEQYESLLLETRDAERSWLWYQVKEKKGMDWVIERKSIKRRNIESDLLITNRYHNLVYIHKNSANIKFKIDFNNGMQKFSEISIALVRDDMTSLQMKEIYVNQNLTALDRGALYKKIEESEHKEYIDNILNKTEKISELFYLNGSITNRLAPQDFYLMLADDTSNGRCYPLVRAMSVALSNRGTKGANLLIDRLFVASATPNETDSVLFKSALAKLHSNISAVEASIPHGYMDLNDIKNLLTLKEKNMMFAVNTRTHSMLIGKTVTDGYTLYYFYDPNFGLFSFDKSKSLFSAVNKFMIDNQMAKYYSAFGTDSTPTFSVLTIVNDDMALVPVGNYLNVDNLSDVESLSTASERQQSVVQLIERQDIVEVDIQLKTSLTILDAQQWGKSLSKSIEKISSEHRLGKSWLPLFSNIEEIEDNHYRIQFINKDDPQSTYWAETTDSSLIAFKNYYEKNMLAFEQYYYINENKVVPKGGDINTVPIEGLNAGIAIQSIIQWAENRTKKLSEDNENSSNLSLALKLHSYVNYTMTAHGTMTDAVKITELVKTVLIEESDTSAMVISDFSFSLANVANEGVGLIFNGAVVGFDIYELEHAENESQKVVFGTQLAFDSVGLIAGAGSAGAGFLGAASTSMALGGASVIFAGLGIGFAGLARNFAIIGDNAKAVGRYFYALDQAYKGNGYDYLSDKKALVPRFGAVFRKIDLRSKQIEFDSQYIYRTSSVSAGGGRRNYIFWGGNFPTMVIDKDKAINIRDGIGYQNKVHKLETENVEALILPVIPKSYIKYNYNLWPGATMRHDCGFDVIRRLENEDNFDYDFYIFPSENTITQIYHEYVDTPIEVRLDKQYRYLFVPKLAKEWHGYIKYEIQGGGGEYQISIQEGVKIKLMDDDGKASRWVINTEQLNNPSIKVLENGLNIGGVEIEISSYLNKDNIFVLDKNNELSKVNFEALTVSVVSEDASQWGNSQQTLVSHLRQLSHENKLYEKYIVIENYKHNEINVGRAFFEMDKERFIFINSEKYKNNNMVLGTALDEVAYFYVLKSNVMLRVDISSGDILSEYKMTYPETASIEIIDIWQEDESIYISCEIMVKGNLVKTTHLFYNNKIQLLSITIDVISQENPSELFDKISSNKTVSFLAEHMVGITDNGRVSNSTTSELAKVVMISEESEGKVSQRYWYFIENDKIIIPNYNSIRERGGLSLNPTKEDTSLLSNLFLVGGLLDEKGNEVFYFYNDKNKIIYRQESFEKQNLNSTSSVMESIEIPDLKNVILWEKSILAIDVYGIVYQINADGKSHQVALNTFWFEQHPFWWDSLNELFGDLPILTLFGIKSSNGKDTVPAWYVDNKVVIAQELLTGNTLKLLGRNKDDSGVLIFDTVSRKIYIQKYATPEQLRDSFGSGYQIKEVSSLPSIIELHPNTKFKSVKRVNSGVLLFTENDEILYHDVILNGENKPSPVGTSLIIQAKKENGILIPPVISNVKNLVLSGGEGLGRYVLIRSVWRHYKVIVIDNYANDSLIDTISLPVDDLDSLLVNQYNDDLLLTDPSTGTILMLRQVFGEQSQTHKHLQINCINKFASYNVDELIQKASFESRLSTEVSLRKKLESAPYKGEFSDLSISRLTEVMAPFSSEKSFLTSDATNQHLQKHTSEQVFSLFNEKQ